MIENYDINNILTVRLLREFDCDEIFKLIDSNREFLKMWLPWVDITKTREDFLNFIKKSIVDYKNKASIQYTLIYNKRIVGLLGINDINMRNKSVSIGYWIGEDYQGRGIVSNVCQFLIENLFQDNNIHRIEIRVDKNNIKSKAIPEKLEFILEGILRDADWIDNHYEDVCIYSLIKNN